MRIVQRSVLPGFNITMGFSLTYLCLVVLIPLSGLFVVASGISFHEAKEIMSNILVKKAFFLTLRTSFFAACVNAFFGLIVAWTLVRVRFPGRRVLDAMIDLPFALPTAVSGIALARLYSDSGWIGSRLPFAVRNTELGVTLALVFIGLPFVVRTLQPAIE